jgi:hypothetical protein
MKARASRKRPTGCPISLAETESEVRAELKTAAGSPPARTVNAWRVISDLVFGIEAIALREDPVDWDTKRLGPFQGRLMSETDDIHDVGCLEFLDLGTTERRIARIVHELAEYLLLLRLSTVGDSAVSGLGTATVASHLRHDAASRIETALLAELFPAPKVLIARSVVWKQEAIAWHARHTAVIEAERIKLDGIDYDE